MKVDYIYITDPRGNNYRSKLDSHHLKLDSLYDCRVYKNLLATFIYTYQLEVLVLLYLVMIGKGTIEKNDDYNTTSYIGSDEA